MSDSADAAPAILASDLLMTAEAEERSQRAPVSSGLAAIDDLALDGGFRYGEITSIAGATRTGKTLLGFHAIASHLLNSQKSQVALIDTAGTLSLTRLRDVLIYRVYKQSIGSLGIPQVRSNEAKARLKSGPIHESLSRKADLLLNRVNYMRVFDLAGVGEAIGEVGETWEVQARRTDDKPKLSRIIEDSEEEDDLSQASSGGKDQTREGMIDQQEEGGQEILGAETGAIDMIVIDTIANVVTSVMLKSQVQGQALLMSFMRSLNLLTSRRRICTILINAMVGINTYNSPKYPRKPEDDVSIFTSTTGKPALGKAFPHLIDTSILLSTIPKTRADAEVAFGRDGDSSGFESVGVLEVIKDRNGAREGQWATFEVLANIELGYLF